MTSKHGSGKKTVSTSRSSVSRRDRAIDVLSDRLAAMERTTDLIRRAPMGICEIDFRGPRIKSLNDYICRVLGYTREEMLSKNPLDLLDKESRARFQTRLCRHLAGEKVDDVVEYHVIAKDGQATYWLLKIAPVRVDGRAEGAIVVGQEITEHRQAREALRQSEAHYRTLFDSIDEGFELIRVIRNEEGKVVDGVWLDVNPAYEKHAGVSSQGMIGQRVGRRFPVIEPAWWDVFDRVERTGVSEMLVNYSEYTGRFYEGNYFRFGPGEVGITFRDVTERKRAEEAVKESRDQAELYLDLMGHDINNMHQIALGYLEIARETETDVTKREILEKPIEVLQRSSLLIKNVRKLQRL